MQIYEIIALIIVLIVTVLAIIYLIAHQRTKVIEWLKFAVVEAEKYLGTGTGQLKLRNVYDMFCKQFPVVSSILPFKWFSSWVDIALDTMREWLDKNFNVADYIENRK